jgi:signal transduction histidine kinase
MTTTQNFEVKMRKYNKSNFWYDIIIAPLHFEEKIDHAILVASDITQRKKTERELKQTTKMLRNLSNRLQNLIEIERTTIAREIHDDLGQSITALQMDLYWLRKKAQGHHELQTKLSQMIEYTNTIIGDIHRICTNLRPGILDELGFIPAIEWQINEFQKRTQIKCNVKIATQILC